MAWIKPTTSSNKNKEAAGFWLSKPPKIARIEPNNAKTTTATIDRFIEIESVPKIDNNNLLEKYTPFDYILYDGNLFDDSAAANNAVDPADAVAVASFRHCYQPDMLSFWHLRDFMHANVDSAVVDDRKMKYFDKYDLLLSFSKLIDQSWPDCRGKIVKETHFNDFYGNPLIKLFRLQINNQFIMAPGTEILSAKLSVLDFIYYLPEPIDKRSILPLPPPTSSLYDKVAMVTGLRSSKITPAPPTLVTLSSSTTSSSTKSASQIGYKKREMHRKPRAKSAAATATATNIWNPLNRLNPFTVAMATNRPRVQLPLFDQSTAIGQFMNDNNNQVTTNRNRFVGMHQSQPSRPPMLASAPTRDIWSNAAFRTNRLPSLLNTAEQIWSTAAAAPPFDDNSFNY